MSYTVLCLYRVVNAEEKKKHNNPELSLSDQYVKALALASMIRLYEFISLMHYKSNRTACYCGFVPIDTIEA